MNWQSRGGCQWEQKPPWTLTCERVSTPEFGCRECREDSWAAHIHFHVHTGAEEAGLYCFNHSEIFPSLWFTRRVLWCATDFMLRHSLRVRVDRWQLTPACLRSISRGDRSAALDTSWWWHSFGVGGRWSQCHHHAAPDVNCHLRENEPAKKAGRQVYGYIGRQAVEQNQEKGAARKMPTLKTGYISNRHSSALKFSRGAVSEWNFTEQVSERQFKENWGVL